MITNAYKLLCSLRLNGTQSGTFPEKKIKDYNGTSYSISLSGSAYQSNRFDGGVFSSVNIGGSSSNSNVIGIYIGTGDTAPTPDDYTLESPLTSSSITRTGNSNASALLDENNNVIGVRKMVTYQNITSDNIIVKEIGTFWDAYWGNSSSNHNIFLIERTVLDEPVTLEPNGTITVAFDQTY